MSVREVVSKSDAKVFLNLPVRLYKNTPRWVRPLNDDIEAVFDSGRNSFLKKGVCKRWILEENGQAIGRIAAFSFNTIEGDRSNTGRIGFFECVESQAGAFQLFDACANWLRDNGAVAMEGPVNFGERDRWWGLLTDGFDLEPNYLCNYNFPYYSSFFSAYGFTVSFEQYTFGRNISGPVSEKALSKARNIKDDPNYSFGYLPKSRWRLLPEYITAIYNKAWAARGAHIEPSEARMMVKKWMPILDERLLFFGYYKNEPIAFFISLPEVNQTFKLINGNLNWSGRAIFGWHRWRKKNRKAFGLLYGIIPEHQGKGVDGALSQAFFDFQQNVYKRYDSFEIAWVGDFNPRMIGVAEQMNARIVKTHKTFIKTL